LREVVKDGRCVLRSRGQRESCLRGGAHGRNGGTRGC
jgi:hypothetical protein